MGEIVDCRGEKIINDLNDETKTRSLLHRRRRVIKRSLVATRPRFDIARYLEEECSMYCFQQLNHFPREGTRFQEGGRRCFATWAMCPIFAYNHAIAPTLGPDVPLYLFSGPFRFIRA